MQSSFVAALSFSPGMACAAASPAAKGLRLGGHVLEPHDSPEAWVKAVRDLRYNAAFCPLGVEADEFAIRAYRDAAQKADITIAEVMVAVNPLHPDEEKRRAAFDQLCESLHLADRIGARCCMAIGGFPNGKRLDPANLSDETFDAIVETARSVIDTVEPSRAFYVIEILPSAIPDSLESYVRLLDAIDRKMLGAHLDPVNLIDSSRRFFDNAQLLRACFAALGPRLKSCHAKDIELLPEFPVRIRQRPPGPGGLDFATYLREISRLPEPPPLMIEHLDTTEAYRAAAEYIRAVGAEENLRFA